MVDAFIANLKSSLNLSSDDSVDYNTPLIELGLDSLVAVGIRTWFLQEIKVDMPVMKILGGASALELVLLAAEKIPQGILPNFGDVPNGELGPSLDVAPPSATIPRPNKPAHLPKPVETQHPSKSVPRPPTMTSGSSTSTLTRSSKSSPPPSSISTAGGNLQTPPSESETRLSGLKLVLSQADIRWVLSVQISFIRFVFGLGVVAIGRFFVIIFSFYLQVSPDSGH
jgi:hybrid polyketide synthase/nonribosomal peptide synthetase ACE1